MSPEYWFGKSLALLVLLLVIVIFIRPKLNGLQAEQYLSHVRRRVRDVAVIYLLMAFLGFLTYLYYKYVRLR